MDQTLPNSPVPGTTETKPDDISTDNIRKLLKDDLAAVEPETIGPYRILKVLGSGGMGIVYQAEQREPVKRIVALKVIKLGMDTKEVIARFESERQALAMMEHPNIAKVFDAGATDAGRPYFVMEYVAGDPLTDYCDKNKLTTRQRLELLVPVCDAVQHAHMKGIIHRDLKPSNVLVTVRDGQPSPRIIDFGIAKATNQRLTERTFFTDFGQLLGTPEYMSPEQAEMSGTDVDTRTDVYSLGVILYELLVGALPFDAASLRRAAYAEIQRIIREVEPPRPSTRLTSLGADATTVASRRRVQLRALTDELKHELEWIPLRALRKDRTERYQSARDLAQDITNYLQHKPLIAGPPTTIYRLKKFVRRHRTALATAAGFVVVLGVATGIVVAERIQRNRAVAREIAGTRSLINATVPLAEQGQRMIDALGADVVLKDFSGPLAALTHDANDPEQRQILANIQNIRGMAFQRLNRVPDAIAAYEESRRHAEWLIQHRHQVRFWTAAIAQIGKNIAAVYQNSGDFPAAKEAHERALPLWRKLYTESPDDPRVQSGLASALNDYAKLLSDSVEAMTGFREAAQLRRKLFADEPQSTARAQELSQTLAFVSYVHLQQGQVDAARASANEAIEILRGLMLPRAGPQALTPDQLLDVATSLSWLAACFGDPAEALRAAEWGLSNSPENAILELNKAHALLLLSRFDAAQAMYFANAKTSAQQTIDDLKALRRVHPDNKDLEKMEKLLSEFGAQPNPPPSPNPGGK